MVASQSWREAREVLQKMRSSTQRTGECEGCGGTSFVLAEKPEIRAAHRSDSFKELAADMRMKGLQVAKPRSGIMKKLVCTYCGQETTVRESDNRNSHK